MRMHRPLTFAGIALVLLAIVLPLAAAVWLSVTPQGLVFLAAHVPGKLGPARIHIGHVSGTLLDGIEVDEFTLEHELVSLRVEHLQGRVELLPLLWQMVDVRQASIGSVYVAVHRRIKPTRPSPLHFLPRLLGIRSDRLDIGAATIVLLNGQRLEFTGLSGTGVMHRDLIRIFSSQLDAGLLHGEGAVTLRAATPLKIEAQTRWTWHPPEQPTWTLSASASGDLRRLGIAAAFTQPFRSSLHGAASDLTGAWHWGAEAAVQDFDLRAWNGGGLLGRLSGKLGLEGNAAGFAAQGTLESGGLAAGPFDVTFSGRYADRVLTATNLEITHRGSQATVTAAGDIGIAARGPRLDLHGSWRDFRWPLVGKDAAARSPEGRFTAQGIWPYTVSLQGPLLVPGVEQPIPMSVRGELAKTGLRVSAGRAELYHGSADFTSEVIWSPAQSWTIGGEMHGLDPGVLRPDFPGRLDFAFAAHGAPFGAATDVDATVSRLTGRLRGAAASGSGHLLRHGSEWRFESVRLQAGALRVALDGTVGAERNLRFDVAADDLAILAAGSRGSIRARGELRGTATEPILRLTGSGAGIVHSGIAVGSVAADVDFDPGADHESHVKLHAEGLSLAGRRVDGITVALDGRPNHYALQTTLRAATVRVALRAAGPMAGDAWHGTVSSLTIDDGDRVALALDAPTTILASRSLLSLERLCLHDATAKLCGELAWRDPGLWTAAFDATHLPMTTLTAGITPDVTYEGSLNLSARAKGEPTGPWTGNFRADLLDAAIRHVAPNGRAEVLPLGSGVFALEALPQAVRANFDLDAHDKGRLHGSFVLQRVAGPWTDMPVHAEVQGSTDAVGFVTAYLPDIDRAAGRLDLDVVMGGRLGAPSLSGRLGLTHGQLDLYQINLGLREVRLDARLRDGGLDLDADAHAGEGTAHVTGSLAWNEGSPQGTLKLTGKELRIVNVPEARIFASPDLSFALDGRKIDVKGSVDVPYARIIPANLTGAVLPSGDEVIVGEEPRDPAEQFTVRSDITLKLGDRVSIDTAGLTGRLTGSLAVLADGSGATQGRGELNVEEGKYVAYGRKLDIERGRLLFNGGVVADPAIDIRAIKQFPDIKAGMNVRGTLQAPRITFFSDPPVPQSQIVSLLLAGGSLESIQGTTAGATAAVQNQNAATRNELLAQGGAMLAQQLGSKIGLEDVGLESNLANETSLVLGKYLSPRLYVSYGIGITQAVSGLMTRYILNEHWTIRTQSGKVNSSDLVYTIEKK
jgi:translocation and assembly module TamB